jgi:hypothetical protein
LKVPGLYVDDSAVEFARELQAWDLALSRIAPKTVDEAHLRFALLTYVEPIRDEYGDTGFMRALQAVDNLVKAHLPKFTWARPWLKD